jgi:glycosyltransferase involved in cell wall biosynthesis
VVVHIVFLSRWQPVPADNGSKLRIYNLLQQLGRRHDVTLLTFADPAERLDDASRERLARCCRAVRVFPYAPFQPTSRRALTGLFSSQPRYLLDTHSEALAAALDETLARETVDLIVASQLAMVPYAVERRAWPCVLEELELTVFNDAARRPLRDISAARARLTWLKLAGYLRQTLPKFDACTVVSDAERTYVGNVAPSCSNVHVVPNAVDGRTYDDRFAAPEPDSLVFAGALTYDANFDGARWFLQSVYPRVLEQVPAARFRITGKTDGVNLSALPMRAGCETTGYVADVRPIIAQSRVSVVPLRMGGGTRLKILESMALGTPVVSTAKGAEGLDVTHGDNILIANDPAEFAEYVRATIRDPELRARLSASGRELVRSRYDWSVVGPKFCDIVERAAASRTAGASGGLA